MPSHLLYNTLSKKHTDYLFPNSFYVCVFGRSSKILLLRRDCCLWSRRVSSGLRQRQQNPAPKARLLPLVTASFIGSPAEAAKSCSQSAIAAFDPGAFIPGSQ